ncbi:hypothetical protein DXG01_011688 [Tephrocybe rancida]|nr:hypothetical protein DXG01_011688 [Tephrocybe rancida]
MVRTRTSPPERQKRPSDPPLTTLKPRKTALGHHKRLSAHYNTRPHGRKPRNSGATETPLRRTVSPADQYKFDPDDVTYYDSDPEEAPISHGGDDNQDDDEKSLFIWEEESTLFSDLLDASSSEPEDHGYDDLVDALQPAFDERGRELKREIAETLVPTVNRVKGLYERISTNVDEGFGRGIIIFNNACKELEALAMRDEDEIKDAWAQLQRSNKELFAQLKDAYTTRERLWSGFEKELKETVEPTLEALRAVPANVECIIGNLEKQARQLEKDDVGAVSAAEKKIKGLLAKA